LLIEQYALLKKFCIMQGYTWGCNEAHKLPLFSSGLLFNASACRSYSLSSVQAGKSGIILFP
jgi:hypothetical protein